MASKSEADRIAAIEEQFSEGLVTNDERIEAIALVIYDNDREKFPYDPERTSERANAFLSAEGYVKE